MADLTPLQLDMIREQVRINEKFAAAIKENLEYADGGAYYQDKDRMNHYLRAAFNWKQILKAVGGEQ